MYYQKLAHTYRSIKLHRGETKLICFEPREPIRAWAYEQEIRYTLRRVQRDTRYGLAHSLWIGFYNAEDAFAFKMRWG
ncbi:MAG: hypothetical protein EOP83_23465 [Verrucomicrobiaceae bacterium]|nr:MAG: hypothetical protein EOP83_23465 [Verrucomicrobiaceae bacterium]